MDRKRPQDWENVVDTLVEMWGIRSELNKNLYDKVQNRIYAKADQVNRQLTKGFNKEILHSLLADLMEFFDIARIRAKFPAYRQRNYLENLLTKFENLLGDELVAANGDGEMAIENFRGFHSVPIMTIHKSKGIEYSSAYFIGLEDSAFWNFRRQPEED